MSVVLPYPWPRLTCLALRDMGDDSLVGIVDLMTGEKDPRNLMLVFSILKVVMVEWDISNHTEVFPPNLFLFMC